VAIKWFIEEGDAEDGLLRLSKSFELQALDTLTLEFDNVLCKLIHWELLSLDECLDIRDRMAAFPIQHHPSQILQERAFEIATEAKHSTFDCLYLILTEMVDGRMVTADRKFLKALDGGKYGRYLLWVSDLNKIYCWSTELGRVVFQG
jgi:predicted nucleic acid-binding protein